jgi:hypothetical protein
VDPFTLLLSIPVADDPITHRCLYAGHGLAERCVSDVHREKMPRSTTRIGRAQTR